MFRRSPREHDLEANDGQQRFNIVDFRYTSWIIDHHRHNIITKISEPGESWLQRLVSRSLGKHKDIYYSFLAPNDSKNSKANTERASAKARHQQPDGSLCHNPAEAKDHSYRINLSELQRLRLRQLQNKLVQHAIDLRYDAQEPSNWVEDLKQYVQALQDYDYMGTHILHAHDPFIVTGERFIDRCILGIAMKNKEHEADPLSWSESARWEWNDTCPEPIGGTRDGNIRQAWIRGYRRRLAVAAIGGVFLIAPMWLMVLRRSLYTALVSTTLFVTIFGLLMALFLDGLKDVMSSTAAYSAVLVVFVGLTVPNGNS